MHPISLPPLQLVLSLVVLLISFVVTAICTFLIILTTKKLQKAPSTENSFFNVPDESSTNNVKLKRARPSPDHIQTATPFALNGSDEDQHEREGTTTNGVIFVDNSSSQSAEEYHGAAAAEDQDEKTPLLSRKRATTPPDVQFGTISEDAGLWYRDLAGKHLLRFVVLLLLLIFSSMVVSPYCTKLIA